MAGRSPELKERKDQTVPLVFFDSPVQNVAYDSNPASLKLTCHLSNGQDY